MLATFAHRASMAGQQFAEALLKDGGTFHETTWYT